MILKRKRNGKTNYKKRLSLLKSDELRLVVRRTNTQILTQLVKYEIAGDKVLASSSSSTLKKLGWKGSTNNLVAAYFTGFALGNSMKGKSAILDIGLQRPHKAGRIYAAVKGAIDGGLKMNVSEEVFPSQEKLDGGNIKNKDNITTIRKKLK
jgi:large subunit ribosomal protein L18